MELEEFSPTSACTRPPTALFFKGSAPAKAFVIGRSLAGPVSGDARRWAVSSVFYSRKNESVEANASGLSPGFDHRFALSYLTSRNDFVIFTRLVVKILPISGQKAGKQVGRKLLQFLNVHQRFNATSIGPDVGAIQPHGSEYCEAFLRHKVSVGRISFDDWMFDQC